MQIKPFIHLEMNWQLLGFLNLNKLFTFFAPISKHNYIDDYNIYRHNLLYYDTKKSEQLSTNKAMNRKHLLWLKA